MLRAEAFHGIGCCVTHLCVLLFMATYYHHRNFKRNHTKMKKEDLEIKYKELLKQLEESFKEELTFPRKPVSSSDNFYEITDRNLKSKKQQKIFDQIFDIVEQYNNLPAGSMKANLPAPKDYSKKLSDA